MRGGLLSRAIPELPEGFDEENEGEPEEGPGGGGGGWGMGGEGAPAGAAGMAGGAGAAQGKKGGVPQLTPYQLGARFLRLLPQLKAALPPQSSHIHPCRASKHLFSRNETSISGPNSRNTPPAVERVHATAPPRQFVFAAATMHSSGKCTPGEALRQGFPDATWRAACCPPTQ